MLEHSLRHVEFSSDLFFPAELHDKVLIPGLTLADGVIETQLWHINAIQDGAHRKSSESQTHNEQHVLIIFGK